MKKPIQSIKYKDGFVYKFNNSRMIIRRYKDAYIIQFRRLVILPAEEKAKYIDLNSSTTMLQYREYSKYCIWYNRTILSEEGFECLANAYPKLKNIE